MVVIYSEQQQLPQSRIELFSEFVEDPVYRKCRPNRTTTTPRRIRPSCRRNSNSLPGSCKSRTRFTGRSPHHAAAHDAEQTMPLARLEFAAAPACWN
ncbi:MAG: hypothetical protein R3E89_19300 [Thiolinea sp.]